MNHGWIKGRTRRLPVVRVARPGFLLLLAAFLYPTAAWAQAERELRFEAETPEGLDAEIERLAAESHFSGVVLIGQGDEVLFHEAYGPADRERGIPNTPATAFNLASIGKQFTATAILRLAQDGRLDLDAPIGEYLDRFPSDVASRVTIRQLLQMRSGWGDYLNDPRYAEDPKRYRTMEDYLEVIRTIPVSFEPGTDQTYSNISYEVLGGVVEAVTGRPYYEAVRDLVFEPAQMESTGFFAHARAPGRAVPYTAEGTQEGLAPSYDRLSYRGSAAGGVYATAEDLWRFYRAILTGRLLDPWYTDLMLNGFEENPERERTRLGFAGGIDGANTFAVADKETGSAVIVLANLDPPAAERMMRALQDWLAERGRADAPVLR